MRRGPRHRRAVAVHRRQFETAQRQPEIENLHRAVVGEEDVLWLQIAVDDTTRVRDREAFGNRRANLDSVPPWDRGPA